MISGFALTLVALTAVASAASAQQTTTPVPPPTAVAPSPEALPPPTLNTEPLGGGQQQAALPEPRGSGDLLAAIRDNPDASRELATMGPVPRHKVELRDAAALERQARDPDAVRTAFNDNRQGMNQVRHSIIRNRSLDSDISRAQVPIDHVVAADVAQNGDVVIYAYPQGLVPPQ